MFVCLSVCLSIYVPTYPSSIHIDADKHRWNSELICMSVSLSDCKFVYTLSMYVPTNPSSIHIDVNKHRWNSELICMSVSLFDFMLSTMMKNIDEKVNNLYVCVSVCLSVFLSVYLSTYIPTYPSSIHIDADKHR